eukprot:TRINITY_DN24074_c0_g1_i2.p2 TRINITY_DN24074_c0_g1~~TRINITY_DN24074_c0_g1_i2.p2  ORF type:complete len:103 (+),score=16.87 TRINITY_DN24074_c0_g1_i2:448-756(+)
MDVWIRKESASPNAPLKRNTQQFLRLDRKFHRQLLQHFLGKAVDDQRHRLFLSQPALHRVEQLVVADLARRRFMLDRRGRVAEIGRAVQQECRDRSRMPSSA